MGSRIQTTLAATAASITASLAFAGTASAGLVIQTTTNCPVQPLSQPFKAWGDNASYELAPDNAAESSADWTLSGGAGIATGNEPWKMHGATNSHSVHLPSGSSATTAPICA